MIEITIRVRPSCAARFAALLRATAQTETSPGQAKAYRGAARRLEQLARVDRRPAAQAPDANSGPRPIRYTPQAQRPTYKGVDERAVQRVVLGHRPLPVLTRDEARLACWHLTQQRCSAPEIAERIHVNQRTVHRWRAEDRQAVTA